MKDEYYELRGWGATTDVLKMKTLEDLGLADLAEEIKGKLFNRDKKLLHLQPWNFKSIL